MGRPIIPTLTEPHLQFTRLAGDCLTYLGTVDGAAASTVEGYDRAYKQFVAFLLGRGLSDDLRHFTRENVIAWVADMRARDAKPTTILGKLSALSTLAEFGRRQRGMRGRPLLDENPVKTFRWPRKVRATRRLLWRDELQAFMAVERPYHEHVARALLMDTGLRASELCKLDVADVTDNGRAVFLSVIVKGGHRQDVPVSREVAELLRDWLLRRGMPDGRQPLLLNSHGERYTRTAFTEMISRTAKAAGITRLRVSAHKIRHTANYVAKLAGVDIYTRSRLLTHSSLRSQMAYEHVLSDELATARERQREALKAWLGPDCDTRLCQQPPAEDVSSRNPDALA